MRLSRVLPVIAAGALVAATVTPASAATTGVGTTDGTLKVLGVDAGQLLQVDLLQDQGTAKTTDTPTATALLSALHVSSATLGVDQTIPLLQASSTDGEDSTSQPASDIPANQVVGGQLLPASLSALVGADGATSNIGAGLVNLDVLSGILGVDSTQLDLVANALSDQATGTRSVRIDQLSVLDLNALLAGLGIPLQDLPLDTVLGLIDGLGLLPQLGDAINALGLPVDLDLTNLSTDSIVGLVDQLVATPDAVTSLTSGGGTAVCDAVGPVLGGLLGSDPGTLCTDLSGTVDQITSQLPDVQATVDGLVGQVLDTVLGALDGATLLSLDGLDVSMVTTATDAIETSAADVTATLGGLQVGSLDLGALDLQGAAGQVAATVDQVQSTIGGILGQIDPALANLVTVHLLDQATSVTQDPDTSTIVSDASFTGLGIDIAPLDLSGLIASLGQQTSIGDQLTGLGIDPTSVLPVPAISGFNDVLAAASGGADVFALSDGMSAQVASLSQQSSYSPVAATATPTPAPTPAPNLPRTGSNDTMLVLLGFMAAAGALGLRKMLRAGR